MVPNRATQHKWVQEKVTIGKNGLSKTAPAVLLNSLSVRNNLLEIFQEINQNRFEYKKPYWEVVARAYNWRRYPFGDRVIISYNCNTSLASKNFPKIKCFSLSRSKINQRIEQQNLLCSPIPLIYLRRRKMNGGKCL